MKQLALSFLIVTLVMTARSQDFQGEWHGLINQSGKLSLSLKQSEEGMTALCSYYGRRANVLDFPAEHVNVTGNELFLEWSAGSSSYSFTGTLSQSGDKIKGKLQMGRRNYSFTVVLGRADVDIQFSGSGYPGANGVEETFTREDTLRGSVTPEREWWDLTYYHLDVKVDPDRKTIEGTNTIRYRVLKDRKRMQVDLQPPLKIRKVTQKGKELEFTRDGNAHFIDLVVDQKPGTVMEVVVDYGGKPVAARMAPWDGGFSWSEDSSGKPFVATSCQGIGASIWWPNKDHMYDEVDSMLISVTVPVGLIAVANGKLRGEEDAGRGWHTFHWFVANPINNYGVNVNIGDYAHFSEIYKGERGNLDCNYYVLKEDLNKAKKQFKQVRLMLDAFEYWFGPYPFYEDGYKLVEVPYLGMEHQSSVTYGNGFRNGYLGNDLSGTGWGLKFDYIIVHESAHEWFANNITYKDIADMWIHESFATYAEGLYVEYQFGKKAGFEYTRGLREGVAHDGPIIGHYDVNDRGSGDMYPKGASMLHTLRQVVDNDSLWREILRGLNKEFYHSTVTSEQIEDYISKKASLDLSPVFDQYLRTTEIPVLEYYIKEHQLAYRWIDAVEGFRMPLKVYLDGKRKWIRPGTSWTYQYLGEDPAQLKIDPDFYVASSPLDGESIP